MSNIFTPSCIYTQDPSQSFMSIWFEPPSYLPFISLQSLVTYVMHGDKFNRGQSRFNLRAYCVILDLRPWTSILQWDEHEPTEHGFTKSHLYFKISVSVSINTF